jgi:hypothetical protein
MMKQVAGAVRGRQRTQTASPADRHLVADVTVRLGRFLGRAPKSTPGRHHLVEASGGHPTTSDLARAMCRCRSAPLVIAPRLCQPLPPLSPLGRQTFGICRMPASTSSPGSAPVGAPFT